MLALILLTLSSLGFAQVLDFMIEDDSVTSTPAKTENKSAGKAILFSSIFPGSGHFYANKSSVGTFIFPVLEVAFWAGIIYFDNKGDSIERDYMNFADKHYDRSFQHRVEDNLINHEASSPIYSSQHFRLEDVNSQHFYEDIGKYNKYIFGWKDWYDIYSYNDQIRWLFDNDGVWMGNAPTHPDHSYDDPNRYDKPYSEYRNQYIRMRLDAQENYDKKYALSFGVALNRVVSVIDVIRVTNTYNREIRYASNHQFSITPMIVNNQLTPTLNLTTRF